MAVGGSTFALGGCARAEPDGVVVPPHAVTATTAAAARHARRIHELIFLPLLGVENVRMVCCPAQPHRPALEPLGVARGVHILAHRDQLLPTIEFDDVAGGHAHVHNLHYRAWFHPHARLRLLALREHADLLRADDK